MSHPVVTFYTTEKVSTIVHVLRTEKHDGFPVVDRDEENVRMCSVLYILSLTRFVLLSSICYLSGYFSRFSPD